MSITSIPAAQPARRIERVDFVTRDGDPHPAQLVYALAGIGAALDRLEAGPDDHEVMANLSVAARVLSAQLAGRLA